MNHELPDYRTYHMTGSEYLFTVLSVMIVVFAVSYIFYRSLLLSALLLPLAFLYPKKRAGQLAEKRRDVLKMQFRDMLYALSSSLMAGKPIEMAFRTARDDLEVLYPDPETPMIREIDILLRKMTMNETVESALADLADRSQIEDIDSFCNVIITCRKTGGNLVDIIRNTTSILGDKLEIRNEIDILLAQRKFEKKVLNVMPIFLIVILSMVANDYIEPVFTTMVGRMVMTAAIVMILLSWLVSDKIMKISV